VQSSRVTAGADAGATDPSLERALNRLGRTTRTTYVVPPWHLLHILSGYEFNKRNSVCCQSAIISSSHSVYVLPWCPVCVSSDFLKQSKTQMLLLLEAIPRWRNASSGRAIIRIICHLEVSAAVNTYHPFLFSSVHTEELNHENIKKIDELRVPAKTSIAEIDSNSNQDVRHVLMSFLHCYFAIITHWCTTSTWVSNSSNLYSYSFHVILQSLPTDVDHRQSCNFQDACHLSMKSTRLWRCNLYTAFVLDKI